MNPDSTGRDDPQQPSLRLAAALFDGQSALAQRVDIDIVSGVLHVWSEASHAMPLRSVPLGAVAISEGFQFAPRRFDLPEGLTVEVDETEDLRARLAAAGVPPPRIERLQRKWPIALGCLFVLIGLIVVLYVRGVPVAATWLAFALPEAAEARLGDAVLDSLDASHFKPSTLSSKRQQAIEARFAQAAGRAAPELTYRLEFRDMPGAAGINAFALPGGTIVLLDGLSGADNRLGLSDDQILAVLGHELGHVKHKHMTRRLIQVAGISIVASTLWGDAIGLGTQAPVLLGFLKYSRDFEREADAFAQEFLRINGLPVTPLTEFFRKIEAMERGSRTTILRTHPSMRERRERLEQGG